MATAPSASKSAPTKRKTAAKSAQPVLLSGGNPQIAKGDGDEPVQAYIAAMPGWKQSAGRRIDDLITAAVPSVRKAVKWNSPLYGATNTNTWFLSVHCMTRYVKVAFFDGASLKPIPPESSKQKDVRYFHVHEGDEIDAVRFTKWVKQAARLPGMKM